jgi:hypothetical protein
MSFGFIMFCLLALQVISDIVGSGSSKRNDETARDQRFGERYVIDVSDRSQRSAFHSTPRLSISIIDSLATICGPFVSFSLSS